MGVLSIIWVKMGVLSIFGGKMGILSIFWGWNGRFIYIYNMYKRECEREERKRERDGKAAFNDF